MAISRPCPKCQQNLSIPEPVPEKIQCPKCGTVIKFKASAAPAQPEAQKPSQNIAVGLPETPVVSSAPKRTDEAQIAAGEPPSAQRSRPADAPMDSAPSTGILSYLHTVIPKPIVFGFYGAMGGLLGVLLLGELFWLILHPTPQVIEPLIVAVSSEIKLFPGSQSSLKVKIARQGFDGPVRLEAVEAPSVLQIPETTIPATETEATIPIEAIPQAEESEHKVTLRATALNHEKIQVVETIKVYIRPTPPSVGLTVAPIVTVYAAGQNSFGFKITRQRFEGAVRIEVLDLPRGVHIPIVMVPAQVTEGIISVSADKDAELVHKILLAEVRALADHEIAKSAEFQLDVLPPPGKLQLAASPQVTVYPGTENKFSVKIARQEFEGDIQIEVTGAPRGVTFYGAIIPAGKTEAEIRVAAGQDMQTGKPPAKDLRVTAKALSPVNVLTKAAIKEDITVSIPLTLNIDAPPPTVQLAVSPKVQVYPGGKATFGVKISRARFNQPVQVAAQGVNAAFSAIKPVTIPAGQSEAVMEVTVTPAALGLPLKHIMPVDVVASFVDDKKNPGTSAPAKVQIEILAPPSDLQLAVSPEVEVYQAGKCSFTLKIARGGFLGDVQVKFKQLPAGFALDGGVTPDAIDLKGPTDSIVLTGRAKLDVVPKKSYEIEVTATATKPAPDGKLPTTTKKFALTVKPFDPIKRPPIDIVFVLDITQSLDPQIAGVRDGIGQFVKGLKDRDLDVQIGLIGFRDINYKDYPDFEILEFNGKRFTTDTKAFAAAVGKLKAVGGGDPPESSLDAIKKAATDFPFRAKSVKVLLLITDEKPQTIGNSVTMAIAQKALQDKKIDQVHLIVKKKDLPHYEGLHKATKGGFFDFDQATGPKGKENFASILPLLSNEIVTTLGAENPTAKEAPVPDPAKLPDTPAGEKTPEPRAEASPVSPATVAPQPPKAGEASVIKAADPGPPKADEISPPRADGPTIKGMQSTAVYAEKDRIWLMIATALLTAALAVGIALTLVGAQKRYLSQAWLTFGEAVKTLLAGLAAGLLAGIIGQWFYQATSGSAWFDSVSRVIAWAILGGLIGAGMAFFVPNMQWKRAALGGGIGGVIGALGFLLVNLLAKSVLGQFLGAGFVDFLGRLIGAALLGLFIGVMVALAEIASRRYWLEVAFGEREIRTVTLGSATVALGGDEKLASVYVPNAPAKALGFRVDKNRVFCEDFNTGKTTEAPPDEQWTLAGAKVRVCSAAHATPTGAHLQLVVVRDVPLMVGMPLTADDIPGLEAQGADGIVALVSRRPNNPKIYLLRNRSKQAWTVTEADGKQRKVEPGLSIELSSRCEIDFGQVKGTLDPSQEG